MGGTIRYLGVLCFALSIGVASIAAPAGAETTTRQRAGATETFAVLSIETDSVGHVAVQRAGADAFKTARDGQKLEVGDTVRTDDVGRAAVRYSDEAFTRLDVNTTFTLTKLTEEQGARQIEGSLDAGRTWNRTEAVTESGSFEQAGAGATAAVAGTAFAMECPVRELCNYIAVYHSIVLRGADGSEQTLDELDTCDANNGQLCQALTPMSLDDAVGNEWIQANLFLDLVFHGYGPGPFIAVNGVRVLATSGPPGAEVAGAVAVAGPPKEAPQVEEPPVVEPPPPEQPVCKGNGRGVKVKPDTPPTGDKPNDHVCD